MKVRAQKLRGTEAAEIAEAALVMPVVFLFLLGIIWFGRAFNIYSTITQAAQQGAIAAARPSCATCLPPGAAWPGTDFPGDAAVANTVSSVMQASSLDPTQIVGSASIVPPLFCAIPTSPAGACTTTSNNIKICREVLLNQPQTAQIPACGTTVSFQYPFQFYLPFTSLNLTRVLLSAQAQSRMEN